MKLFFSRRAPLNVQLVIFLCLSISCITLDMSYPPFKKARYYLVTLISPLYYLSSTPREIADRLTEIAQSREALIKEAKELRQDLILAKSDLASIEFLKNENQRLRQLLDSPIDRHEQKMVSEVLLAQTDPYNAYIALNKGQKHSVYKGQPVVDEKGVVGQVYEISHSTSRVILICDRQHALPVQILRNNLRMIAVGNGCFDDLTLDYLPANVDIKVGDEIVTSGLGGGFPEGYPVAVVSSVKVNPNDATLLISATPTADLKRLRYLLLLWINGSDKHHDL